MEATLAFSGIRWDLLPFELMRVVVVLGGMGFVVNYVKQRLRYGFVWIDSSAVIAVIAVCLGWPVDLVRVLLLDGETSNLGALVTGLAIAGVIRLWNGRGLMERKHEVMMEIDQAEPMQKHPSGAAGESVSDSLHSESGSTDRKETDTSGQAANPVPQRPLGADGEAVYALTFAGGGYDTVMQIGVTHALLVAQGRAPDVVVGVSGGAVHAAALAEILQAGSESDVEAAKVDQAQYEARLAARLAKFRKFFEAVQRSPERLVDAAFPDAYEIDTLDPLQPLQTPIFSDQERRERLDAIKRSTGLIRLYNDLLRLHLPFGIIVRAVRRVLGFLAANDIPTLRWRRVVQAIEGFRAWLLIGAYLPRLVPIVPTLLRPLRGATTLIEPSTAGSLIFRFRTLERAHSGFRALWSFLLLLSLWVGGSWVIGLGIPWAIGATIATATDMSYGQGVLGAIVLYYTLIAVVSVSRDVIEFDTLYSQPRCQEEEDKRAALGIKTRWRSLRDTLKATVMFFYLLTKWTVVLAGILVLVLGATSIIFGWLPWLLQFSAELISERAATEVFEVKGNEPLLFAVTLVLVGILPIGFFASMATFRVVSTIARFVLRKDKKLSFFRWYMRRFLRGYEIDESLFHPYSLKKYLIELFEPDYYGAVNLDRVLRDSLKNHSESTTRHGTQPRVVGDYSGGRQYPPIHVGIAMANVGTRDLEIAKPEDRVVDALLAATAVPAVLPPQELPAGQKARGLYVDAVNIANVPTRALMEMLRARISDEAGEVQVYSVSPLPISRSKLDPGAGVAGAARRIYLDLIDIALRAMELKRFRDATFERKLTELFTSVIPAGENVLPVKDERFFRAKVWPIELHQPVGLNRRILFAPKESRREVICETIAKGCRAALESMLGPGGFESQGKWVEVDGQGAVVVSCREVVKNYRRRSRLSCELPGTSGSPGPGLPEICQRCVIEEAEGITGKQSLLVRRDVIAGAPVWPNELSGDSAQGNAEAQLDPQESPVGARETEIEGARAAEREPEIRGPTVNLLFSGGVFRGVFQMGVVNALALLDIKPHIIGGASVGSITAGMVAATFELEVPDADARKARQETLELRQAQIARLASAYLTVDRIILTDRFADFVRNLTVRAAASEFSVREADHVLRKYDFGRGRQFERAARRVVAGLERLLYVSPYQLNDLVKAIRHREVQQIDAQSRRIIQNWLDRMAVGDEVLGAEPLETLIQEYVIPRALRLSPESATFREFGTNKRRFIATVTNLTEGGLVLLTSPGPQEGPEHESPILSEGLLSSSAFPGVFRPRWSWELFPKSDAEHQYIDGGVMDNLPIDAMVELMLEEFHEKVIESRPVVTLRASSPNIESVPCPHLVFAASLETEPKKWTDPREWKHLKRSWPELLKRTKQLQYNNKMDTYAGAEGKLRRIYESLKDQCGRLDLLDLEIITAKPRWLCSTFAFHPMLGFRREAQARSIAHGCATTLLAFAETEARYHEGWKLHEDALPSVANWSEARERLKRTRPSRDGHCWLCKAMVCPFSANGLGSIEPKYESATGAKMGKRVKGELGQIFRRCHELHSHRLEDLDDEENPFKPRDARGA